jgi:hypothetical protein
VTPGADGLGGGIYNAGALTVTNSTFALNLASGGNAGYYNAFAKPGGNASGGAIYSTGSVVCVNVTIASNLTVAGSGSAPYYTSLLMGANFGANIANTNGTFTLRNSLLAYPGTNANVWGQIADGGYNISSDGSALFSSGASFNLTDPKLGPLQDNGGPTLTMALLPDSPAIDFGTLLGAPSTDQRGVIRLAGASVDVGAYELFTPEATRILTIATGSGSVMLTIAGVPRASYRLQSTTNVVSPIWRDMAGSDAAANGAGVAVLTDSGARESQRFYRALYVGGP